MSDLPPYVMKAGITGMHLHSCFIPCWRSTWGLAHAGQARYLLSNTLSPVQGVFCILQCERRNQALCVLGNSLPLNPMKCFFKREKNSDRSNFRFTSCKNSTKFLCPPLPHFSMIKILFSPSTGMKTRKVTWYNASH